MENIIYVIMLTVMVINFFVLRSANKQLEKNLKEAMDTIKLLTKSGG